MEETNNTSLKEKIDSLDKKLDTIMDSGKVKGLKIKKLSASEKKKGFVQFIIVGENRTIRIKKLPVDESTTVLDKIPRLATQDYMLRLDNGDPAIILPEWATEPYLPQKEFDEAARNGMLAAGHKLLGNRFLLGEIKGKKKISGAVIFAIIAALLAGGYFLLA